MAFPTTGVHVLCASAGSLGAGGQIVPIITYDQPMSEAPASGVATTVVIAPVTGSGSGKPIFSIRAFAECWVAIGTAPDPTQTSGTGNAARFPMSAGDVLQVAVPATSKLAWIAA